MNFTCIKIFQKRKEWEEMDSNDNFPKWLGIGFVIILTAYVGGVYNFVFLRYLFMKAVQLNFIYLDCKCYYKEYYAKSVHNFHIQHIRISHLLQLLQNCHYFLICRTTISTLICIP